jgi:hypothetical protein
VISNAQPQLTTPIFMGYPPATKAATPAPRRFTYAIMEGAMMKLNWTQRAGALAMTAALSSAVLGLGVAGPADAKGKSAVMKPTPPDDVTTTERGIKDQGIKSCGSCGLTSGRAAAPPPPASGETTDSIYGPGVSPEVVQGQPAASGTERNKSGTLPPPEPSAAKGKTGWLLGIGGLAAIAAVVAVSSGSGTPASP